jgi:hypothetical protein
VGPSTAVTPKPGARPLANVGAEEEKTMFSGDFWVVDVGEVFHNATHVRSRLKFWNESGTNRARIGDSYPLRLRSPQYLALVPHTGTRSSLTRVDKRRHGGEILKMCAPEESNQNAERVNWIRGPLSFPDAQSHVRGRALASDFRSAIAYRGMTMDRITAFWRPAAASPR